MTREYDASNRVAGLDVARYAAFVGMVIVNFKIVMGADKTDHWLNTLTGILEGKAAATFVVLAGIGLALSAAKNNKLANQLTRPPRAVIKRALFLLVLGLVNMTIFDADIIHYYAFYFLIGAVFVSTSTRTLVTTIIVVNCLFAGMVLTLNYDKGWNWDTLDYLDFWTAAGFIRNLFFNGWHPVIPWLGFLLFGFILSRLPLHKTAMQKMLLAGGLSVVIATELLALALQAFASQIDPELALITTTRPVPPMPLFFIAGASAACAVIGLCLISTGFLQRQQLLRFVTPAGRQTLTLYIAHIIIGMGALQLFDKLDNQTAPDALLAAILFCLLASVIAFCWSHFFKHGPIESIMHRVTGR